MQEIPLSIIAVLVVTSVQATLPAAEVHAGSRLTLSASSGKAPLAVSVTGPAELLSLGKGTYQKWTGCGFDVDWGDHAPSVTTLPSCAGYLKHTYTAPGTYTVAARIWHAAPDDSHITDWTDSIRVVMRF